MAAILGARPFEARITPAAKRARAFAANLRLAVLLMVLLNALVWGGLTGAARGLVDVPRLVDQVWAQGATQAAALGALITGR